MEQLCAPTNSKLSLARKAASRSAMQSLQAFNMFPQVVHVDDPTIVAKGLLKTRIYLPIYTTAVMTLIIYSLFTPITVKMDSSIYPPLSEYQGFASQAPVCPCEGSARIKDAAAISSPVVANFSINACSPLSKFQWACFDGTYSNCTGSNASTLLAYGLLRPISSLCFDLQQAQVSV